LKLAEHVALPELRACALQVPSVPDPSLNRIVPVGVPDPGEVAVTVAVNVTDWPVTDGFAEEATAVVVAALFTVCVSVDEVEAL
jgi:hypothetical protein